MSSSGGGGVMSLTGSSSWPHPPFWDCCARPCPSPYAAVSLPKSLRTWCISLRRFCNRTCLGRCFAKHSILSPHRPRRTLTTLMVKRLRPIHTLCSRPIRVCTYLRYSSWGLSASGAWWRARYVNNTHSAAGFAAALWVWTSDAGVIHEGTRTTSHAGTDRGTDFACDRDGRGRDRSLKTQGQGI